LASEVLDARGLKCPLPVLKLEKQMDRLASGMPLTVLATDPMAKVDIPLYCRQHGHSCVVSADGEAMRFDIVAGGSVAA
jgi:tRNA 2-thiouridine synthesizing protein A